MRDLPPTAPDLTGRTLGDFQVVHRLGQGGMGTVYLAKQLSLKREVALKLLRTDMAANATALKRFQAEAEAVARISHPNIVQVYAIGEHEGLRYMALEYVKGKNLRDFLEKKGPPDLPIALAIMRQIAAALQRASELGIVHRDIKPENILLTKKTEVKVTDFGLSRLTSGDQPALNLTQSGMTLGTPLYMAPEQVRGQPTDHRSDLYSFGVTCYHLLAGTPPFYGANVWEVANKHVFEQPQLLTEIRPDLPIDLCHLVHKLMAKDPNDRYASAKEVIRDLAKIREGLALGISQPQMAFQPSGSMPTQVPVQTLPLGQSQALSEPSTWPIRILGSLVLLGVFGGGWWLFGRTHQPATPPVTQGVGLPTARLPDPVKLLSAREQELKAKLNTRTITASEVIDASIDLGLLYVKERRFADAERVFSALGEEKFERFKGPLGGSPHTLASKLGLGIVLAHQDKTDEAIASFQSGLPNNVKGTIAISLRTFLTKHRELTLAVSEAVQRIADNRGDKRLPPVLELLRTPGNFIRDGV